MPPKKRKLLALDSGGIRSILALEILAVLEAELQQA
jgi:patatin-like phospholipase/acyl hydrolase